MKTVERYVFGSFLVAFLLAFLVLTFVTSIGLMVQVADLVQSQHWPASLVMRFLYATFPETLQLTIPLSLLAASVLVFSRLSSDSEVAAMRACGVNLLSVIRWPLAFAALCTAFGLYVNNEIVPRGHEVRRNLARQMGVGEGLEVLEPGRVIDEFPKVKISFESFDAQRNLQDVLVLDYSDERLDRMLTAAKAEVKQDGRDILLTLHGMTVDPVSEEIRFPMSAGLYQFRIQDAFKPAKYKPKEKDFTFSTLWEQIRQAKADVKDPASAAARKARERAESEGAKGVSAAKEGKILKRSSLRRHLSELRTEMQRRWVSALASICFVLLGIPLGISAQRKDSASGIAVALMVGIGYFGFVMLFAARCSKYYAIHPEILIWLPVAVCIGLAARLLPKNL